MGETPETDFATCGNSSERHFPALTLHWTRAKKIHVQLLRHSATYRSPVNKHGPLSLVGDEKLSGVSQFDDSLPTKGAVFNGTSRKVSICVFALSADLPSRSLQLEVDVNGVVCRAATDGDLGTG